MDAREDMDEENEDELICFYASLPAPPLRGGAQQRATRVEGLNK